MREFFTQWELYVALALAAVMLKFFLPPLMRRAEQSGHRFRERNERHLHERRDPTE